MTRGMIYDSEGRIDAAPVRSRCFRFFFFVFFPSVQWSHSKQDYLGKSGPGGGGNMLNA